MELLDKLNERQREAVEYTDGPLLILAGAGSGKTRVLTYKIAYMIETGMLMPYQVLAITFTNKAAKEMKERVSDLVEDSNDMWLGTFHSICVRILKREIELLGYTKDFTIFDESDKDKLIKDIMKRQNIDDKKYPVSMIGSYISKAKDIMQDANNYITNSDYIKELVLKIYTVYEAEMKSYNAIDFDDILMLTVKLFKQNPDRLKYYQNKFRYILVDEYQDTNKVQFNLISMLAADDGKICVVGDESQSIYGFRGADISNILNFEKQFVDSKIIKLEENYRSTKNILNAANSVIKNNKNKIEKVLFTSNDEGDKIKYYNASNEYQEVEYIINEIDDICRKENKTYSDFAMLYRTNAQSRVIEDMLIKSGTPYKLVGGLKFYSRKEIKDTVCYLKFVNNLNDNISLKRIINVPKRGIGDGTVDAIENISKENNTSMYEVIKNIENVGNIRGLANIIAFREIIEDLLKAKEDINVSEFIKYILERTKYEELLKEENSKEAENRLENLAEFIGMAIEFENESADNSLADFLDSIALFSDADKGDDTTSAVTLMTIHSAKGLEFDVVFLVGMEEGLFPSKRSIDEDSEVEEERRLYYVAITRARQKLYITHSTKRTLYGQTSYSMPSRFVDEIPLELYQNKEKKDKIKKVYNDDEYSRVNKASYGININSFLNSYKTQKTTNNEDKDLSVFDVGVKVRHKKFGVGIICDIEKEDDDLKLEIKFEQFGFKRLMAKYSPLDII